MAVELNFESVVSMIENMITGVGVFELNNGKITPVYLNEGLSRMLGYSMQETKKAFKNVRNSIIPDDLPVLEQAIIDVLKDDGAIDFELRTVTLTGGMRWLQVRANLYARKDDTYTIVAVLMDATERKNVEEELKQQAERLHIVAAAEGEMILDYNVKTDVMMIRDASDTINRREIIINNYFSKFDNDTMYEDDIPVFFEVFKTALKSPKHDSVEIRTKRYDGDYKWYQCSITSMAGVEGYVTRVVGRLVNIDERKKKELDLKVKAEKDALTGIFNKGATEQLIKQRLEIDSKDASKLHALMIIDLDNFKEVNDVLGHATGDQVLIEAATKIASNFKGSDIVGRIGGDEFIVLMRDINAISNTDVLATRLCRELKKSLPSSSGEIAISSSVGISIFPYHGATYEELFEKADKALYTAKANGKDGYRIFDAAATLTYHANRKNNYAPVNVNAVSPINRNLEDIVMQVLFEDKEKNAALSSILELITLQYGLHRAFICSAPYLEQKEEQEIRFLAEGYEVGKETAEKKKQRLEFCKSLSRNYTTFGIIHQYDEMEDETREFLVSEGIKCLLYYPFYREGSFLGAIIFEDHKEDEILLSEEQKNELKCILRIVNASVFQDSFIGGVQNSVAQIQMMDNMDNYVYVIDAESYQINFVNRKVVMATPDVHIGEYCYRYLGNKSEPCENCLMKKLDRENHHAKESEERFNYSLRAWTRTSACWLECNKDSATCMMNCMDISDYLC